MTPGFSGAEELETMRISIPETLVKEEERSVRLEEEIFARSRPSPEFPKWR
jgi:hypothetical protein